MFLIKQHWIFEYVIWFVSSNILSSFSVIYCFFGDDDDDDDEEDEFEQQSSDDDDDDIDDDDDDDDNDVSISSPLIIFWV